MCLINCYFVIINLKQFIKTIIKLDKNYRKYIIYFFVKDNFFHLKLIIFEFNFMSLFIFNDFHCHFKLDNLIYLIKKITINSNLLTIQI